MDNEKNAAYKICRLSASAVAIFTLVFIITLILTFDFSEWRGIDGFQNTFRPIQMLTVIPSLFLAISYVIFITGVHICTPKSKKIWSQLAISFGLLYAGISIANYLIQLITVIPSIQNNNTEGIALLVSGYPNSVFYALMASYFLMCLSLLFASYTYEKENKAQKWVRRLFQCAALAIPLYLTGAIFNIAVIMMSGALCWIIGTIVGMFVLAVYLYK